MGEEAEYLDDGADYIEPDVTCENCIYSRYKRNKKQNILICQVTGEINYMTKKVGVKKGGWRP